MTRRRWTVGELRHVSRWYGRRSVRGIAAALGRTAKAVYLAAVALGKTAPYAGRRPGLKAFVADRHARGWTDAEIGRAWGCDRHTVSALRVRLGLPVNAKRSAHDRERTRRRTAAQLAATGVASLGQLRGAVWQAKARALGWPAGLRLRHAQILSLLWDRGPMTRRQLCAALGMEWRGSRASLKSRDPEGSYLAHLIARGLVVQLGRADKRPEGGKGTSNYLYALGLWVERGEVSDGGQIDGRVGATAATGGRQSGQRRRPARSDAGARHARQAG